jgi:hypothetical protein
MKVSRALHSPLRFPWQTRRTASRVKALCIHTTTDTARAFTNERPRPTKASRPERQLKERQSLRAPFLGRS